MKQVWALFKTLRRPSKKLGGWERGSLLMNCDNRQDIG